MAHTTNNSPNGANNAGIISGSSILLLGLGGSDTAIPICQSQSHDQNDDMESLHTTSTHARGWGRGVASKMLKVMMGVVRNKAVTTTGRRRTKTKTTATTTPLTLSPSSSSADSGSTGSTGSSTGNGEPIRVTGGLCLKVSAGDVIVLPAGTAHCSLSSEGKFRYVGVYPAVSDPLSLSFLQRKIEKKY